MDFLQAKRKLKEIAKGKYHTIRYGITENREGELSQECQVYINGYEFCNSNTWERALKQMQEQINPPTPVQVKIDKIPEL